MNISYELSAPTIGRVVILEHPKYAEHAEAAREDLRSARPGLDILTLPTQRTVDDAVDMMESNLQPDDVVLIEGGDGSRSKILSAALLMASSKDKAQQEIAAGIAFMSGTAGNGRDGARSERGRRRMNAAPSWVLRNSVQMKAWGMQINGVERAKDHWSYHELHTTATLYANMGGTALAAELIASPDYQDADSKLSRDLALTAQTLTSRYHFSYVDSAGVLHTVSDLTFGKGHAIGKLGWLPVESWHRELVTIPTKPGVIPKLGTMARVTTDLLQADPTTAIAVTPTEDVLFSVDGEPPIRLMGGQLLQLSVTDTTYNLLTTRLKPRHPIKAADAPHTYI